MIWILEKCTGELADVIVKDNI